MQKPFSGDYPITQIFGANPDYYKKFGLAGHEGLDFGLPNGTSVLAAEEGRIVRRNDDFKNNAYGVYVVIWHDNLNLATWYAHLQEVKVVTGDSVTKGQLIGISDNTGNTTGPHLHWGLCQTDSQGYRTNKNNGYQGFIDPMPYITGTTDINNDLVKQRADAFVAVCAKLGKPVDKDIVLADIDRLLTLEGKLTDADKLLSQKDQQLKNVTQKADDYQNQLTKLNEDIDKAKKQIIDLDTIIDTQKIKIGALSLKVDELQKIQPILNYSFLELLKLAVEKIFKRR